MKSMIRKIILLAGVIFCDVVQVKLHAMHGGGADCKSPSTSYHSTKSGDTDAQDWFAYQANFAIPVVVIPARLQFEDVFARADTISEDGDEDLREGVGVGMGAGDRRGDKDRETSDVEIMICNALDTEPAEVCSSAGKYTISPGEHLYWSIVALIRASRDHVALWKKEVWEARGMRLHRSGPVGCELVGNLIRTCDIGVSEYDETCTLPARDSALLVAAKNKDLDVIRVLIIGGVHVDARCARGFFALFLAAGDSDHGDEEDINVARVYPIDYLLARGADVTQTTADGKTALHQAARSGFLYGMRVLTKYLAWPDTRDGDGCTSLHYVCTYEQDHGSRPADMARVLLNAGARVDIKNHDGDTPWESVLACREPNVIKVLQPTYKKRGLITILLPKVIQTELIKHGLRRELAIICLAYYDPKTACAEAFSRAGTLDRVTMRKIDKLSQGLQALSISSMSSAGSGFGSGEDEKYAHIERVEPGGRAAFCRRLFLPVKKTDPLTAADEDTP